MVIVRMILGTSREVKQACKSWLKEIVGERMFDRDCVIGCMYKQTDYFVENSVHFVLKIELLLTMLSNFVRDGS